MLKIFFHNKYAKRQKTFILAGSKSYETVLSDKCIWYRKKDLLFRKTTNFCSGFQEIWNFFKHVAYF